MTTPVPCHTCGASGRSTSDPDRACPRCDGDGLRDAREAAAHKAYLAAIDAEKRAVAAMSPIASRAAMFFVDAATATRRKARDVWENELARVASENGNDTFRGRAMRRSA